MCGSKRLEAAAGGTATLAQTYPGESRVQGLSVVSCDRCCKPAIACAGQMGCVPFNLNLIKENVMKIQRETANAGFSVGTGWTRIFAEQPTRPRERNDVEHNGHNRGDHGRKQDREARIFSRATARQQKQNEGQEKQITGQAIGRSGDAHRRAGAARARQQKQVNRQPRPGAGSSRSRPRPPPVLSPS